MSQSIRHTRRSSRSDGAPEREPIYDPLDDVLSDSPFDDPDDDFYAGAASPANAHKSTKPAKPGADMRELAESNLSQFFGNSGPLAQQLEGYELRPSQVEMAETVKKALLEQRHALLEAPTGTGKSIAYLVPAILSGKTVVIATANKSLQSQLYLKDIPFLRKVLQREISAVLVKGRSNFVCTLKWENESFEQQRFRLYDKEHEQVAFLRTWLEETDTGDVDDLPFMLDSDLRSRIVSFPDDCLHDDCRHDDDGCWVNYMRDKAASAQILITNHHLLLNALELGYAGERILPPAPIYVIDEAHGLEQTATAVYETVVSDYTVELLVSRSILKQHIPEDEVDELRFHNTLAFQEVSQTSRDNAFRIEGDIEEMKKLSRRLSDLGQKLKRTNPYGEKGKVDEKAPAEEQRKQSEGRRSYELLVESVNSAATKLMTVASSTRDGAFVRYATRIFDRRHISLELHAAPIDPASLLSDYLFHPEDENGDAVERTVICTSATLATEGNFTHYKARCGIQGAVEERVLPAVFDYPRQALLYQPALPAYDFKNADAYYAAVAREIERLLEVSRGRALCLFTAWSGLQHVCDRIKAAQGAVIWPVRAQGDAPRDALLSWFRETPHSVLLATRSFWEGVDIPGDDLSLVVLDKMPFPTPSDPLHSARMKAIDNAGRSSFGEYMAPLMTLSLKQGFGRLIRRGTDRGVVAILDERLTSKGYGRQARADLPAARFSRDFKDVHRFFQSAIGNQAEFALNVWAWRNGEKPAEKENKDEFDELWEVQPQQRAGKRRAAKNDIGQSAPQETSRANESTSWRWQLLRLLDGKADVQEGMSLLPDASVGEMAAALDGLANLRQRIQQAGRRAADFAVEVRWRYDEETLDSIKINHPKLWETWAKEQTIWRSVHLLQATSTP